MKRIFFILLLFFSLHASAAITYLGSASSPSDNGTSATSPVSITPVGSMTAGDLVFVYVSARNASATFSVSNSGGQTWNTETLHNSSTAVLSGQVYWCVYNGTWSANPSWTYSSTTNTNAVMHVFRPTGTTYSWALNSFNAGSGNFLVSTSSVSSFGTGQHTPANYPSLSIGIESTDDDNTYDVIAGTDWVSLGNAQYRNTSGSDVSSSYGYVIRATNTGTINQGSKALLTLGPDPGIQGRYSFYEVPPASPNPRRITVIQKP